MQEVEATPVEGAVPAAPATPEAPATTELKFEDITPSYMEKLARSGDSSGMDKAYDILKAGKKPDVVNPVESQSADATPPSPATGTVQDQKKLVIDYRGSEVPFDDNDGYMGKKDIDGLKKSYAHKELFIEQLKKENADMRDRYSRMEAELIELKRKSVEAPTQKPINTPQPTAGERKIPVPPAEPNLPADQFDWTDEDRETYQQWLRDTHRFQTEMVEYVAQLQQGSATVDPEIEEIKAERKTRKQEDAEAAYWSSIRGFQSTHKSFQTPVDVARLHGDLDKWADELAYAMGESKPTDQTGARLFENRKMIYVKKFLDGDQEVTSKAQGVQPPTGYRQYYDLALLQSELTNLKQTGVLGESATLHDAYMIRLDRSGQLDEFTELMKQEAKQRETEARLRGVNDLVKVMESAKTEAIPVPNNLAHQSTAPTGGISLEDQKWFDSIRNPVSQLRTPADRERYDRIGRLQGYK